MLKWQKPWIDRLATALAGSVVQVDAAAGAQTTALGPTQRLNR